MRALETMDLRIGQSENESDALLLEYRWFAAQKAASRLRVECDLLREVMDTAHAHWRDAAAKLANVEALCAGLEQQYVGCIERNRLPPPARSGEMSAA